MTDSLQNIGDLKQRVDVRLRSLIEDVECPAILRKAMAHSLLAGGKRLRPLLTIASSELFPNNDPDPMPAACAVECIHTYSLIHDDLPSMDDDSLRRGVPTCHIVFGEAVAILAGDALLTEAFNIISSAYTNHPETASSVVREMASAAGCSGMVGGQVLDIIKENPSDYSADETGNIDLGKVHEMKTGALIRACFVIGGIIGGGGEKDIKTLASCGSKTGLAFQVIDDCLDATGTDSQLGKNAGSDARKGKGTFVELMGIDKARRYANELKEEALSCIAPYGERGDLLKRLIRQAVERRS